METLVAVAAVVAVSRVCDSVVWWIVCLVEILVFVVASRVCDSEI